MDDDLAFCLGQFVDDQIRTIDEKIEEIEEEEKQQCEQIQLEQQKHEEKKAPRAARPSRPPMKERGSHDKDQRFVEQFIKEVSEKSASEKSITITEDSSCIETLRAEITTKVGACSAYVTRLRTLAKPLPNTDKFVASCDEVVEYLRKGKNVDDHFQELCLILQNSDDSNYVQNTKKWWKNAYGSSIAELNNRNRKFNSAVTNDSFATLSETSRIVAYAKGVLSARQIIVKDPPKVEMIQKFARELLRLDKEQQKKYNSDQLAEKLNAGSIDEVVRFAKDWLNERDAIRNEKEEEQEEDVYEQKIADVKAECGRQILAQGAKKLALAALLCRLAVGSNNDDTFKEKLNGVVQHQSEDSGKSIAVISADIKNPDVEELPLIIRLEVDDNTIEQWRINAENIQETFASKLCGAFEIPPNKIRVDDVDVKDKGIHLIVLPPYGKKVIDSLNGDAPDAAARMEAVRQCCLELDAPIYSITMGEFGLEIENRLMDPKWNRKYVGPGRSKEEGQYWEKPINQGGKPYFCPSGWTRYGVKVATDEKEFDAQWGKWRIGYHGTRGEFASNILTSGLRVSNGGCFYEKSVGRVYLSPSIEYCAHPRYALPWQKARKDGKVLWYQLVFQCRVNPRSITAVKGETLLSDNNSDKRIDPNFSNNELEWVIVAKNDVQFIRDDIICYGLMMRSSTVDPDMLPSSQWWKYSLHNDIYKNPQK